MYSKLRSASRRLRLIFRAVTRDLPLLGVDCTRVVNAG
jgi:hypothetical protein